MRMPGYFSRNSEESCTDIRLWVETISQGVCISAEPFCLGSPQSRVYPVDLATEQDTLPHHIQGACLQLTNTDMVHSPQLLKLKEGCEDTRPHINQGRQSCTHPLLLVYVLDSLGVFLAGGDAA